MTERAQLICLLGAPLTALWFTLPSACSSDTVDDPFANPQGSGSTQQTAGCSGVACSDAGADAGVGCTEATCVEPARTCTLIGCGAPLSLVVALELPFSAIVELGVEVCWNEHCLDGTFAGLEEPQPTSGVGVWEPEPHVGSEGVGWIDATVWAETDGTYRLEVSWNDGAEFSATDGDTFRVSLTDAEGSPVFSLDGVAEYEVSYPNGEGCGTCLNASFAGKPVREGTASGSGGTAGAGTTEPLGDYVMTWYTFQDNTPSNSAMSASGRPLIPYISVALPFRLLAPFGGTLDYGDRLYIEYLAGRLMPNGLEHTGWVELDDFCGDNEDDSYCYQEVDGNSYPNVDLWIGDFTVSGLSSQTCEGPAGSGQELTAVYTGSPGAGEWVIDYGGRSVGTGPCGDSDAASSEQQNCWDYTPPPESAEYCGECTPATCAQ